MKTYLFLFDNIAVFYWVAVATTLNALISIGISVSDKTFKWSKSLDFLKTMLYYCLYLIIGNAVDQFTEMQGYEGILPDVGFKFFVTLIMVREVGGIINKLGKLQPIRDQPEDKPK